MHLRCGSHSLDLSTPVVMGILNVTPDSFSDGGRYSSGSALAHAMGMIEAGARIIDVGGESTRPGAAEVSEAEEIRRVIPIIGELAKRSAGLVSVDTSKPGVMRAAVEAGAVLINDVRSLTMPGALAAAAMTNAGICLMHMQGEPRSMQHNPQYEDVVAEVCGYLRDRLHACIDAGIASDRIALDPGIGFGKRLEHNLQLLARLPTLAALGRPLLIGVSRKSMFGALLGRPVDERLAGGVAVAAASILAGAKIIRTHDVAATLDAVKVAAALQASDFKMGVGDGS